MITNSHNVDLIQQNIVSSLIFCFKDFLFVKAFYCEFDVVCLSFPCINSSKISFSYPIFSVIVFVHVYSNAMQWQSSHPSVNNWWIIRVKIIWLSSSHDRESKNVSLRSLFIYKFSFDDSCISNVQRSTSLNSSLIFELDQIKVRQHEKSFFKISTSRFPF